MIDGDVQNRVCILGISSVLNRESKSCHLSSELAPPAGYTHHSLTFNSMFFWYFGKFLIILIDTKHQNLKLK